MEKLEFVSEELGSTRGWKLIKRSQHWSWRLKFFTFGPACISGRGNQTHPRICFGHIPHRYLSECEWNSEQFENHPAPLKFYCSGQLLITCWEQRVNFWYSQVESVDFVVHVKWLERVLSGRDIWSILHFKEIFQLLNRVV